MQIGYRHSTSLQIDEPIVSSSTGAIVAQERNGRIIERREFINAEHMASLWIYLWIMHGKPAGHPDRPYITIKRDNAQ